MSDYTETLPPIRWADEPKPAYDVVIIGGGGHGLSTAYHLAARHGITSVAVLEADYIASGNTGRNTTIIRANYGIPEAIRFYQHSLELYQGLEAETGAAILHQTKGIVWLAHTEMAMRTERARAAMNQACGAQTFMRTPQELKELDPAARPDRRRPLPGHGRLAPCRGRDGPPRPRRVGVRERGLAARRGPVPAHPGDGHQARRRPGDRRGDVARADRRRRGAQRGGRARDPGRGHGRRPAAGPDASAPRVRDQRPRPGLPDHPRQHRARLLRLPDRARPDADRRRVRRAALVLAAGVVRRAPLVQLQDHAPAAVPREHADPAPVGRHLRHLAWTSARS